MDFVECFLNRLFKMVFVYLLWIASWLILALCWLLSLGGYYRSLFMAFSWKAPFRGLKWTDTTRNDRAPKNSSFVPDDVRTAMSLTNAESDPASVCLAHVLELIPDVTPDYATGLIGALLHTYGQFEVLERVLHALLEKPEYPRVNSSNNAHGAGRQINLVKPKNSSNKTFDFGYGSKSRPFTGGPHYTELALKHLGQDFPFVSELYLAETLASFKGLYAPTHIFLFEKKGNGLLRYLKRPWNILRTKDQRQERLNDDEFNKEREWILEVLAETDEYKDGIECGCCFSKFRFRMMIQCSETHLFCSTCLKSYASTLLATHNPDIRCLDRDGCTAPIPESELRRFLPDGMMRLWERAQQRKQIQAADLKGLEECPFCDFGVIIESNEDKLLRCGNVKECGVVSCRTCKKPAHLPMSCDEEEKGKLLSGQHHVEEAMSRALMRNCPLCNKPVVKIYGCNFIRCVCGGTWCYVCRRPRTHDQYTTCHPDSGSPDKLHASEIKAARDLAILEYKRSHPDIDENKITVSLT